MIHPVTIGELLAFRERLGVTQVAGPLRCPKPVGQVFILESEGEGLRPPFSRSVLILSPAFLKEGVSARGSALFAPALLRDSACAAVAEAQKVPAYLSDYSERTGTPIFASRYPAALLESRLAGLIRETGERKTMVHGVLLRIADLGVLIMGESGIGKTACSLSLAARGHAWVADDAVVLEGRGTVLYGRGHEKTRNWIAPRGRGILRAEALLPKKAICREARVDLIVHFVRSAGQGGALDGAGRISMRRIAGVDLSCRRLAADFDERRMAEQVMAVVDDFSARRRR